MSKKQIDLSRRKLIAGLGTAGVAAAGAGLGTTAYLNDEESFTENQISAGTLDMVVSADLVAANGYWADQIGEEGLPLELGESDGGVEGALTISDVKPGDWGIVCFDVEVSSNPGYVTLHADNLVNKGGDLTEPEEAEMDDGEEDDGELSDNLLVTYWDEWDDDEGGKAGLTSLNNITNVASDVPMEDFGYKEPVGPSGEVEGEDVEYTTLREMIEGYEDGTASGNGFDAATGNQNDKEDGILVGGTDDPTIVGDPNEPEQPRINDDGVLEYCLLFEIPTEVGNEIQDDSVTFDLGWTTEQVRNNDDPRSDSTLNTTGSPPNSPSET